MTQLNWIDFTVIGLFFLIIFGIAARFTKSAGKSTGNFFLSGRDLPWYLAGTAMVATTFAADTPLAVTEIIALNGIAGNWLWWNLAIGGMLTAFFFAKLWRRSGVMTDVEFIEFRYSGKEAAVLRGFRSIYLGLLMNGIVLGWVHLAMETIFRVIFPGANAFLFVVITALLIGVYASASGLKGTARTDSFQFVFAMAGCIVLAIVVIRLPEVGGIMQLKSSLDPEVLGFFPKIGSLTPAETVSGVLALPVGAFIAYVGVQWWSSWYPGADPGGGGYIAQRIMSAKDEKHSLLATLWFNVAHYTIRPWPWILVALCALVILPRASSPEALRIQNPVYYEQAVEAFNSNEIVNAGTHDAEFVEFFETYENTVNPRVMYPKLMVKYLPAGLLGLLVAVFLAAYMSTIASQLNWGTSYLVNDFYRRFIKKSASEKHYVAASRICILLMIIFSLIVTRFFLSDIRGAWLFVINASAGMGAVLILRWFWWRINAWSEISAMIAPLFIYPFSTRILGLESPITLFPIVLGTTIVWLTVTFVTRPVDNQKLCDFFRKVHPGGRGWKNIAAQVPEIKPDSGLGKMALNWGLGVVVIYCALFGTGKLIFAEYTAAVLFLACSIAAGVIIYRNLSKE